MNPKRLMFRTHAVQRMFQRRISVDEIESLLASGKVIEDYPDDKPYASRLVLGYAGGRPLHVVVADDVEEMHTIVITVYEPDLARWEPGFRRRRQ